MIKYENKLESSIRGIKLICFVDSLGNSMCYEIMGIIMEKEIKKDDKRNVNDILESFFIAREIMGIQERATPFEINQVKNKYPSNGCRSKKELRAWVQKQNLIRKFRAFVEEKEAGLIQ